MLETKLGGKRSALRPIQGSAVCLMLSSDCTPFQLISIPSTYAFFYRRRLQCWSIRFYFAILSEKDVV